MSLAAQRVQLTPSLPLRRFRASARAASRPLRARRLSTVASADAESPALPAAVAVVAPVVRTRLLARHTCRGALGPNGVAAPRMRAPCDAWSSPHRATPGRPRRRGRFDRRRCDQPGRHQRVPSHHRWLRL